MNTLNVIETPDLMKPNEISFRKSIRGYIRRLIDAQYKIVKILKV